MLPSFCLCFCVHVCFVCPFASNYIHIVLWAFELLKIELLLLSSSSSSLSSSWMLNYLQFKTLFSRRQNLDALFLINVFRTKLTVVLLWILLVSWYPLSKSETSPHLTSVMSQDLALQQDASRLQTTANFWTFSINITSPLRIHFPCLNPTQLYHYRVTCIIFFA
jgi:hypothetical protein